MPLGIDLRTRILPCATLVWLALNANTAMAQSIQGTATFRERLTLPPAALFEAFLENVDAPAEPLGLARIPSPGNPPIAFTIAYDPGKIVADRRYVVRARILVGEQLWFTSDTATPVITRGAPVTVSILLRRVEAGQTPQAKPAARPIAGTYWSAIELIGKPTPTQQASQEAHLIFQPDGRVAGADGCNRVAGSYELKGDAVKFGPLVGTRMACLNTAEVERGFREALETAARLVVTGDRLELFDTGGRLVAVFTGRAQVADAGPFSAVFTFALVRSCGGAPTGPAAAAT